MNTMVTHSGVAAALRRDNIDTDVIIPMEDMLGVPLERIGSVAFRPLRFLDDGSEQQSFVLNQLPFRKASILIAGRNFGSGSSRERAVNAVAGMGISVIIAPSFGDIFYGNCFKNGLLPIRLDEAEVAALMDEADAAAGGRHFVIDLEAQQIMPPFSAPIAFEIEAGLKHRLVTGEDDISLTLKLADKISAYQDRDRLNRPWIWAIENEASLA